MTLLGYMYDNSISLRWQMFFFKLTFMKNVSHEIWVAWLSWVTCTITVSHWDDRFFFKLTFVKKASHEIFSGMTLLGYMYDNSISLRWQIFFLKLSFMKKVSHEILVAWLSWVRCAITVSLWHERFFFSDSLSWKSISRDMSGMTLLDYMCNKSISMRWQIFFLNSLLWKRYLTRY